MRVCLGLICPYTLKCSLFFPSRLPFLLYPSALVGCEDRDPISADRNFDVESAKKEIQRGRKLKCTFCGKRGATVGCDLKSCAKNYHFFCAKMDDAFPQANGAQGTYKVFCQQHALKPSTITQSANHSRTKRGKKKCHSTVTQQSFI